MAYSIHIIIRNKFILKNQFCGTFCLHLSPNEHLFIKRTYGVAFNYISSFFLEHHDAQYVFMNSSNLRLVALVVRVSQIQETIGCKCCTMRIIFLWTAVRPSPWSSWSLASYHSNARLEIEGGGKTWRQNQRIRLRHVDTGGYLHSHDRKYTRIAGGQQEVSPWEYSRMFGWILRFSRYSSPTVQELRIVGQAGMRCWRQATRQCLACSWRCLLPGEPGQIAALLDEKCHHWNNNCVWFGILEL